MFVKEKESIGTVYFLKLNQLSYRSEFQSFFAYGNDLILVIPKTKQYCCKKFYFITAFLYKRNANELIVKVKCNDFPLHS